MRSNEKRSLSIEARVTDLATSQFARMLGSVRQFAGVAVPLFKATAVAFGSISAAGVAGFVVFRRYADELDKIAKVSDKFGITAESLTALRNGAELAGISVDELATSMKAFETAVEKANDGGQAQLDAFRALGLEASSFRGEQLDLVEVMAAVAGGLQNVGSASERTAALIALFGKQGADLAPLLKVGSDGIRKLATDAAAVGAVFSREELQRVEDFNDSWTKLTQTFKALAQRIVVELSPALNDLFNTINDSLSDNVDVIRNRFATFLEVLVDGFEILGKIASGVQLVAEGWGAIANALQYVDSAMTGASKSAAYFEDKLRGQVDTIKALQSNIFGATGSYDKLRAAIEQIRSAPPTKLPDVVVEGDGPRKKPEIVPPSAFDRFGEGIRKATAQWTDFAQTAYESGNRLVGGTLDALTSSLAAGIARTKTWSETWKAFGVTVKEILAQVIAKMLIVRALSGIGQLIGIGSSSAAPTTSSGATPGGEGDLGTFSAGLAGPQKSLTRLPSGGTGGTVNVNFSITTVDAAGFDTVLRRSKSTIVQIVGDAMARSNGFRGQVKEASA